MRWWSDLRIIEARKSRSNWNAHLTYSSHSSLFSPSFLSLPWIEILRLSPCVFFSLKFLSIFLQIIFVIAYWVLFFFFSIFLVGSFFSLLFPFLMQSTYILRDRLLFLMYLIIVILYNCAISVPHIRISRRADKNTNSVDFSVLGVKKGRGQHFELRSWAMLPVYRKFQSLLTPLLG